MTERTEKSLTEVKDFPGVNIFQGSQFQQWVKPTKHSKICEEQSENSCNVNVDATANELKVDMDWPLSWLDTCPHW